MKELLLITLAILTLVLTEMSNAATPLNMKPGKWRIKSTMSRDGKPAEDPMKGLAAAMKSMTPEKRKQMEAMMETMRKRLDSKGANPGKTIPKIGFDEKGMTMCYTKEMLANGDHLKQVHEKQKCKITKHDQSSTKVTMDFTCENGSSGHSEWNVTDPSHIKGLTKVVSKEGKKTDVNFNAEFLSESCN